MYKHLTAMGVLIVVGCHQPKPSIIDHSADLKRKYIDLAKIAVEENDLVTVAVLHNLDDSQQLMSVMLESNIAALVEGSVSRYSVQVRRRDAVTAKAVLREDARLRTLLVTIEP